MLDLYLSPSTQEHNICIMGDKEEDHINKICDLMIPYLNASGISWKRNKPTMSHITSMQDSNATGVKMHYAMHSNASNGKARGNHVYYKPFSSAGKFAATLLMDAEKLIYPLPDLCKVKLPLILYTEIYSTKAEITIIDEFFYHDNLEDATWGHNNLKQIAKAKAQAVCKILGKVFIDPSVIVKPATPAPIISRDPIVPRPKIYTVKSGDTLGAIATLYKTTVAKLVSLNGIKNASMISVGQIIKISGSGDSVISPVVKPVIIAFSGRVLKLDKPLMLGEDVRTLQNRLNLLKFNCGRIDGFFGDATVKAVKGFQRANKLVEDGQVGKLTWAKLFN